MLRPSPARELKNDLSTTRGATLVVLTLKVSPIKSCTLKVVSCTLSMFQATGSVRPARAQAGPLMIDSEAGPSGTHTLMLRLGVRLLHALRQLCANTQDSGPSLPLYGQAKEKLTRVGASGL